MATFSERNGYQPVRSTLQFEQMDDPLRNALWDAICFALFQNVQETNFQLRRESEPRVKIANRLWNGFFKKPVDTIPEYWFETKNELREFFMSCLWCDAYSLIEFLVKECDPPQAVPLKMLAQGYMIREAAAYRFIGSEIVPIVDANEISAIEVALQTAPSAVKTHLETALSLFSDRLNPNYRNSIKESISAVEAAVQALTNDPKATLGQGLKNLPTPLPKALSQALDKLYGYTSDHGGIRHALSDEPTVEAAEARFMLIACSAFLNLLRERSERTLT